MTCVVLLLIPLSSKNLFEQRSSNDIYQLFRYAPPQRVWFFEPFWSENGIDFDHYGLKSGMVSSEPRERINVFVFSTSLK